MSVADEFRSRFDETGRYLKYEGVENVTISTRGGTRFPAKLRFKDGLCVEAEMKPGGVWQLPDEAPLSGIRFLLYFGEEKLYGIAIEEGRIIHFDDVSGRFTKRDFLGNIRIARNLFVHPRVESDGPSIPTALMEGRDERADIWLTPESVSEFNIRDFPELGLERQKKLQAAVQSFLSAATQVATDHAAAKERYRNAVAAFTTILEILGPYLPLSDEARVVEKALRTVDFPVWVLNWDYELGMDSDDELPVVRLNLYVDEQQDPGRRLGWGVPDLTMKVDQAFADFRIERRPYIRLRTAVAHKAG